MSRNTGPCVMRFVCGNKPVVTTGLRAKYFYPNGGTYSGYWRANEHHLFGIKTCAEKTTKDFLGKKTVRGPLIYKGYWRNGKRHGQGSLLRRQGAAMRLVYAGQFYDDMKSGEGKQIYDNGNVYFGQWKQNRRHGLGIQWYIDGRVYLGEWRNDTHHGLGVMFYVNGNHYEGNFARGYKNGEGTFIHITGQIQKGMWQNDIVKVSIMKDRHRQKCEEPTQYPIPKNYLRNPNHLMRKIFQKYMPNANKPMVYFSEQVCLEFNRKYKQFFTFEERFATPSKLNLYTNNDYASI